MSREGEGTPRLPTSSSAPAWSSPLSRLACTVVVLFVETAVGTWIAARISEFLNKRKKKNEI